MKYLKLREGILSVHGPKGNKWKNYQVRVNHLETDTLSLANAHAHVHRPTLSKTSELMFKNSTHVY